MKIAILGAAGRMGRKLCELAPENGLEVVAKVDVADGFDREWPAETEGVVDFSHHTALPPAIAKAAACPAPFTVISSPEGVCERFSSEHLCSTVSSASP